MSRPRGCGMALGTSIKFTFEGHMGNVHLPRLLEEYKKHTWTERKRYFRGLAHLLFFYYFTYGSFNSVSRPPCLTGTCLSISVVISLWHILKYDGKYGRDDNASFLLLLTFARSAALYFPPTNGYGTCHDSHTSNRPGQMAKKSLEFPWACLGGISSPRHRKRSLVLVVYWYFQATYDDVVSAYRTWIRGTVLFLFTLV